MIFQQLNPRLIFGLTVATAAAGCQLPAFYRDLGATPTAMVRLPGHTLVLAPTTLPDDLQINERIGAALDSVIGEAFATLGYAVVPAGVYGAIWDSLTVAAGGFFDPFSGRRKEDEYAAAVGALFGVLKERFAPDIVIYPGLWVTEAEVTDGFAAWDGQREYFDLRVGFGTVVLGLSLMISVEDMAGKGLHEAATGVRLIERYSSSAGVTMIESVESRLAPEVLSEAVSRVIQSIGRADTVMADSARVW